MPDVASSLGLEHGDTEFAGSIVWFLNILSSLAQVILASLHVSSSLALVLS